MQTSGDSRVLAAGIGNDLYLWRFDQVGTPQVIRGESGVTLLDGDVSSDGQLVITVDSAGEVRWWDTRAARSRAQGQHKGATTVALANGGWLAATGSGDSCVRLWARNGYDAPADLCPHDGAKIDAVRFSLDDAHLFTASDEGIFRVWDVMKARLTAGVSLRQVGFGFGYAVSADGRHAAFADFRGKVSVVDLKTVRTRELEASVPGISAQRKSFGSPTRPPYVASAIANEGKTVLVAGSDGAILKWHLEAGDSPVLVARARGLISSLALTPDGRWAAVASGENRSGPKESTDSTTRIMVLDLVDGHEVFKVDVSYPVHELVLTEDGRELLTLPGVGRFDRQCRRRAQLWQLRPGRLRAEFDGCPSVAVMESGQVVTYSLDDRRIRVWNQRGALEGLSDTMPAVSALALTRDRSRLAVGSPAGVDIVDMKTLRRLITIAITPSPLPGASFGPTHLRYTPDDSQLVILHGDLIRVLNAVRSRRADVRVTVRSVLSGETFDLRRPSRQWNDELIQRIAAAQNMDRQIQEAVIAELRRMGDRDPIALCNDSRQVGVRTDAKPEEYQQALRNALRTYELAPWSADCLGVLGIARYRVQDYVGALDAFERARQIRWDYDYRSVELAFKAMTLQRLDRRVEAAAVAGQARAGGAVELTEDVKNAIKELATIVPTAGSSR